MLEPIGNTLLIHIKMQFSGMDSSGSWKDGVSWILRGGIGLWGSAQLCQEFRPCLRCIFSVSLWLHVHSKPFSFSSLKAEEKQEDLLPLLFFCHLSAFLHSGKKPCVVGDMKNWTSCFPLSLSLCPGPFERQPRDPHSGLGRAAAPSLSFQAVLLLGMKSLGFLTVSLIL